MKKLVIAEKPLVAQAIAKVLNVSTKNLDGYYESDAFIVSWCIGHLIGLASPEAYDEKYRKWNIENLPISPDKFLFQVNETTKKQFNILKELMQRNDVISLVCATDAGREGELIFRHVYNTAKCSKPFERLWISSLENSAIKEGFQNLKKGTDYDNLYYSALCREEADWLVGMNFTRLFTVLYQSNSVLSIGRVQTPTLAILCERANKIANFKKEQYFLTHIRVNNIDAVSEKISDKSTAEELANNCNGKTIMVDCVDKQIKTIAPPKLYDLTTLQREANKKFGYTAKQTLEYAQSLYEKKLITYPRTDSQFLTESQSQTAKEVIYTIYNLFTEFNYHFFINYNFSIEISEPNIDILLNNKKVSDHHAIIPTVIDIYVLFDTLEELPDGEKNIFYLIICKLICATSQKHTYETVKAQLICNNHTFTVSGKSIIQNGWKDCENDFRKLFNKVDDDESETEDNKLPELEKNMIFDNCVSFVSEHYTQPPKQYTEDTLLSAMERAGNDEYDTDEVERKGLGTPATRDSIIETLIKREYVERKKKNLIPTEKGLQLIKILPDKLKSVSLTAEWENKLVLVSKGEYDRQRFMKEIVEFINEIIANSKALSNNNESYSAFNNIQVLGKCPHCDNDIVVGKYGAYCKGKCGMNVSKAFGKELSDSQIKSLLAGEKILLKNIEGKKGSYDAYLIPEGIENFNYTNKEGKNVTSYHFKFKMEFPKKK